MRKACGRTLHTARCALTHSHDQFVVGVTNQFRVIWMSCHATKEGLEVVTTLTWVTSAEPVQVNTWPSCVVPLKVASVVQPVPRR